MQRSFQPLVLACALALVGCASTKKTTTKKEEPPPPPPKAAGETLRYKGKAGDKLNAKAKLLIEFDLTAPASKGKKPVTKHVVLTFDLNSEEKIDSVDSAGNLTIAARLADAVASKAEGFDVKTVDDFSLALDELKINLVRTPRGDITSVGINGVRAPLDDRVARSVVNALYSASRGAVLPEDGVDVNATWKTDMQVPLGPNAIGQAVYTYTFAKKEGTAVTITSTGTVTGEAAPGKKVNGKITSEYKLDNASGKLASYSSDITSQIDDASAPTGEKPGQQRIKVDLAYQP